MTVFIIFMLLLGVGLIIYSIVLRLNLKVVGDDENIELLEKAIVSLNLSVTKKIIPLHRHVIIIVDEINKKIVILSRYPTVRHDILMQEFYFKDILSSEIYENGNSVTVTSRSSQIGKMLLGTVVAGGVGAIIGGLSAKQISTNQIRELSIRITVNNLKEPVHTIQFNPQLLPVSNDDPRLRIARQQINELQALISVIIKQNDDEDRSSNDDETVASLPLSIADELLKLSELLKQGIITQDEFHEQKKKILSA